MHGRKAAEVGGGHAAEHLALLPVDGGFGGVEGVLCGAGFDFHKAERVAFPGDEVEVAAEAAGGPLAGDDGEAEGAEEEKGFELTGLADCQVGWAGVAMGGGAEEGAEEVGEEGHGSGALPCSAVPVLL